MLRPASLGSTTCFHLNENQQNEQNRSQISNEPTTQKRTIPNACPTKISKITIFSLSAPDATMILDPFSLIDFLFRFWAYKIPRGRKSDFLRASAGRNGQDSCDSRRLDLGVVWLQLAIRSASDEYNRRNEVELTLLKRSKSGNEKLENYQNCRNMNKNNESEVVKRRVPKTLTKPALTTKKERERAVGRRKERG